MIRWTPDKIALLGTMTDREVAEKIGVSSITVAFQRYRLNIGRHKLAEARWTEELLALLGKVPDRVIAETLGCSAQVVLLKRHQLDIEACHKRYPKKKLARHEKICYPLPGK